MDAKINSDHNFFTNILHKIITINIIKLFSFILIILFLYSCSVDIEEVKGKKNIINGIQQINLIFQLCLKSIGRIFLNSIWI